MNGIVVIDKPPDITSAKVVARVKKCFKARKTGHAGTLDPFATGVLICLINRATRLADFFLHGEKTYAAALCLGVETDTQDGTGQIIATASDKQPEISPERIKQVCRSFVGELQQAPPAFSAVKHKGRPLYEYARQGVTVSKPARRVQIFSLQVMEIRCPLVRFKVTCSGGTYIRTLAADIGRRLGCGAYLQTLRRTRAAGFDASEALKLEELELRAAEGNTDGLVIRMSEALRDMPACYADPKLVAAVRSGRCLSTAELPLPGGISHRGKPFKVVNKQSGGLLAVMKLQQEKYQYCCVFPEEGGA